MYQLLRQPLSQNFLWNRELVNQLIRASSIAKHDSVLEIGPGTGIITHSLLATARQVIAVEADYRLHHDLTVRFSHTPNLRLIHGDILNFNLPHQPYKVFSNIPFSITGEIIRKLLLAPHPPSDSYLILQSEAASKFIAGPGPNTMAAFLYYPFWAIRIVHTFNRTDFSPAPKVDSVLVRVCRRDQPLIASHNTDTYHDFLSFHFGRDQFAKYLSPDVFLAVFNHFQKTVNPQRLHAISGAFSRLQSEQSQLSKIHRTRTDPRWKKFQ